MENIPQQALERLPQPPAVPFLGNAFSVSMTDTVQSMMKLADEYGPIYRLKFPGHSILVVSSADMVAEISDPKRFEKSIHGPLQHIRDLALDGLFTAYNHEPNWGIAHRILRSAFGPAALSDYHDMMLDIAEQLALKWERFGPDHDIDVPTDMTRLAIDTVALCAFGYRMNSFYRDDVHSFIKAIRRFFIEAGERTKRPPFLNKLLVKKARHYHEDIAHMHGLVDGVIAERQAKGPKNEAEEHDLLSRMLNGRDPETGQTLSAENIRYQVITFFIAGHETSGGLMSFVFFELLRNPEAMAKARAEVDRVMGPDRSAQPTFQQIAELKYCELVVKEALRKWPTAAAYGMRALKPETLGGKYPVAPSDEILILQTKLHRDPKAWGADAEEFRPERFAPENAASLHPHGYKPFGSGMRACIGQFFAIHEAKIALAMLLHRFDFEDPYRQPMAIKETLTIKPKTFYMRAKLRKGSAVTVAPAAGPSVAAVEKLSGKYHVLFGSKMGSAERFAKKLAGEMVAKGATVEVAPLNDFVGRMAEVQRLILVSASYEGQPPENAVRFHEWLASSEAGNLSHVQYAVFGCGHTNWKETFQAVPAAFDENLARAGAVRLLPRGVGNAAKNLAKDFDAWKSDLFSRLAQLPSPATGCPFHK